MKLGWYEVILWLVPQPFYCHLCPSFPHLSGLSTQLIKLKDNTETTNMYSVFTGHLAKSASDYFYRNPLLTTKQSYLLMSTHICAEISACTEAKLAGILIQEQQEATEEMLVYWQCHSTEDREHLHISQIMTYWTRQQEYFLWTHLSCSFLYKIFLNTDSFTESVFWPSKQPTWPFIPSHCLWNKFRTGLVTTCPFACLGAWHRVDQTTDRIMYFQMQP